MKKLFALVLLLIPFFGIAQQTAKKEHNLKTYYLVLLKKGPNRTHDSLTAANIQKGHMEHINSMAASGKLAIAGPMADDGELRGIFILNVRDEAEARNLTSLDPAVRAGRLIMEIHPWMSEPGNCLPK